MTPVLVDSNIFLDIITDDRVWRTWSEREVEDLSRDSVLVINPVIYAELSAGVATAEDADRIVPPGLVTREAIPWDAAFLAGKCFRLYRARGGIKQSPLPDFFIGAHAAVRGYRLLTRDVARYRSYFPTVELIAPA